MLSQKGSLLPGCALAAGSFSLLQSKFSMPWWGWVLLLIVLVILLYFIIRGSGKNDEAIPEVQVVAADDLTIIEGIGPKINQLLHDAGIKTFSQLAAADLQTLENMLHEANLRMADPATWAEQARLASAGEMEALQKLLDDLKGGRRE